MVIVAVCDTEEEDTKTQVLFWNSLNEVMVQEGYPTTDFAGFMADEAGANWAAIRLVFNDGPDNEMVGRERSCLFHWEQSLQKHNKKYIPKEKTLTHLQMCENWCSSKMMLVAQQEANAIRIWWKANVPKENVKPLERWFKWWEKRISHWGNLSN